MTAKTAAEAYERYTQALAADLLIQEDWHKKQDGRTLACALGVLGEDVYLPSKCPAQIMPGWLAELVPWFFDRQHFDDAKRWGKHFYAELKRLDGRVPFSVFHDWEANVIAPLTIAMEARQSRDAACHIAKRNLHLRALAGDIAPEADWYAALKTAYVAVLSSSRRYYEPTCDDYVDMSAKFNARYYARDDNDRVSTPAYVDVYAANLADNHALDTDANPKDAYAEIAKQLADGMVQCLARVGSAQEPKRNDCNAEKDSGRQALVVKRLQPA